MVRHLIVIVHWFYLSSTFPNVAPYRAQIVSEPRAPTIGTGACIRRRHIVRVSVISVPSCMGTIRKLARAGAQRIYSFQEIAEMKRACAIKRDGPACASKPTPITGTGFWIEATFSSLFNWSMVA